MNTGSESTEENSVDHIESENEDSVQGDNLLRVDKFEEQVVLRNDKEENYKNKSKRAAAVNKLLPVYVKIKPGANFKIYTCGF